MTPEPSGGYYVSQGVEQFIRKFGYPDKMGRSDRMNFGGIFRIGVISENTGLTLSLQGYDVKNGRITDPSLGLALITGKGETAALWHYSKLIEHWKKKHNKAAYVPSQKRMTPLQQHRYGSKIVLGIGTDFSLLLKAFATGVSYYDPGIKLEGMSTARPTTKRRSQFRVKWNGIRSLYNKTEIVDLNGI